MPQTETSGLADAIRDVAPVAGPFIGGLFGWLLARAKRRDDVNDKQHEHEKDVNVATLEATNQRFQTLMDGYEQRIGDLTAEVHALREEVKSLRKALDQRATICAGCPRVNEWSLRTGGLNGSPAQ